MDISIDLHAHSSYAGGTGNISLNKVDKTAPLKGIDIIGTGDVQFPSWNKQLRNNLTMVEGKYGLYELTAGSLTKFVLQTELIFTARVEKVRKQVHTVILLPTFETVSQLYDLLQTWNVKTENVGRPFVTCKHVKEVSSRIHAIFDLDPYVEVIPAHILTPNGVFGGNKVRINRLEDFYGDSAERIQIIETGLSADPLLLGLIPELDDKTLLSNSDAHSLALHRVGREFSVIELDSAVSYPRIIDALRKKQIKFTAEFHPSEGRYFLTGHRAGKYLPKNTAHQLPKNWHDETEYCIFSPKYAPEDDICPICKRRITVGALQRAHEIGRAQNRHTSLEEVTPTQDFIHMIPLIEIIAYTQDIKTLTSKTVLKIYKHLLPYIGTEVQLWQSSVEKLTAHLAGKISDRLLENILHVKKGNFTYQPFGYDGVYGKLVIGTSRDYMNVKKVSVG